MDTALAATAPQTLIPEPRTLSEKLATLPLKPLLMLGVGAAALAAVAIALALRGAGQADYRVLFAGLSDKDGGAVLAQLSQMNVPYKHSEGGGAILVPADKVLDVRMKLSNLGLPKSSTVGYELLDTQKFGQSQAGEGMSMKRATEGELMRTIGSLAAVQQVRVHLALPAQNGFFREQQKPSASVMLTLHPGRTLDRAQISGIVHLVSSSVPDLNPKAVSVVDGTGALLTEQDGGTQNGLDTHQLQYRQQVETSLQKRLVELLEPVVGREHLRATVTADIDFTETMSVSEEFKPNNGDAPAAVKSTQVLESTQAGANTPSGVPGAQSNQPPVPGTAAAPVINHNCGRFLPGVMTMRMGIDVGYADDYAAFVEFQYVDITRVRPGSYLLVHRADPDQRLLVGDRADDVSYALIRLAAPARAGALPRAQVLATSVGSPPTAS